MFRINGAFSGTIAAIFAAVSIWISCGVAYAQQANQSGPILIKFSHITPADSIKGKTADYFKKLAEERTKGAVKVEVYPNSVLYKDKEELEALQMGAVQMLAPTQSKFGPLGVKEFEVLDLPYLVDNLEEEHRVTQGPIGMQMLKKLEPKGIKGLAFWDNGFKQMTANVPLRKPEDFKGKKFRIASSKIVEAQFRAVGALPQTMAFSELYQALDTGLVDGQENPNNVIYPQKIHEVQKYLTISNHAYHGNVLVTSIKFWQSLPQNIRTILDGVVKDSTAYYIENSKKEDDYSLEKIRASGKTTIITLTPEERLSWKKAFVKIHPEMAKRVGQQLIDEIYKETNFDPNAP